MDNILTGYNAAKRFLREHTNWAPIVRACVTEAERCHGEFAGAWVLQEARKQGIDWFPNLKPLVSYGVLTRTGGSRGGRRAYYVMPDPEGVKTALQELGIAQ